MYRWRTLTDEERRFTLAWRQQTKRPVHSPRHIDSGQRHYLVTAACYEHLPHIGDSVEPMNAFTGAWLDTLQEHSLSIFAWVVLPNHYHALVSTRDVKAVLKHLGQLHGRTFF
jgi:putative transposase